MKKLLTLIAILVSISVHAQFKVDTYKNYMGRWNKYTKEYDLDKEYRYAQHIVTGKQIGRAHV